MHLPPAQPRRYPLREAYRRRIWRSPGAAFCREALLLATILAVVGFLYGRAAWVMLGGLGALSAALTLQLMTLRANLIRCQVIREGARVEGWVERPKRVILLHEFFRGDAARTFALPYTWRSRGGVERSGALWICGCARRAFPPGSAIEILTLKTRSLPLKAATLRMKR